MERRPWASLVKKTVIASDSESGDSSPKKDNVGQSLKSWPPISVPGNVVKGLPNIGSSCFLSATMQAMLCTEEVLTLALQMAKNWKSPGERLLFDWAVLTEHMVTKMNVKGAHNVAELIRVMVQKFLQYTGDFQAEQSDAQEFFQFLLQKIHDDILTMETHSKSVDNQEETNWEQVGAKNRSRIVKQDISLESTIISEIFGGKLHYLLQKRGAKDSLHFEPFFCLSLPIENPRRHAPITSLQAALSAFFSPFEISGIQSYNSRSSEVVRAKKSCRVDSLGKTVVFQLKRFAIIRGQLSKLSHIVSYPPQFPFSVGVGSRSREVTLQLNAVVIHHGKLLSKGHYTCYGKRNGHWYHFNDDCVEKVNEDAVLRHQAYLLFYTVVKE